MTKVPVLALTQGDPAGIGPEILLDIVSWAGEEPGTWLPVLIAEKAAFEPLEALFPRELWGRLRFVAEISSCCLEPSTDKAVLVLDPIARARPVIPGKPCRDDAIGAMAALDAGLDLVRSGVADALVTAPLNKATIAQHLDPNFRGHTDYLAAAAGLDGYGRDYLMAFLAGELRVALLSTHIPLADAVNGVRQEKILQALHCLHKYLPAGRRKIAVAGLNPHAGEAGLLGWEDQKEVQPAVEQARREGIDANGPFSADSIFARARNGDFDWVLALYHDQGLIAVKTAAFGTATHWTLGLPFLRTSVDHGTAYDIAGCGSADSGSLRAVIQTTLDMIATGLGTPSPMRA